MCTLQESGVPFSGLRLPSNSGCPPWAYVCYAPGVTRRGRKGETTARCECISIWFIQSFQLIITGNIQDTASHLYRCLERQGSFLGHILRIRKGWRLSAQIYPNITFSGTPFLDTKGVPELSYDVTSPNSQAGMAPPRVTQAYLYP